MGEVESRQWHTRFYRLDQWPTTAPFNPSSKSNTDRSFLEELHRLGHRAASSWLTAHRDKVGHSSSLNIEEAFLSHANKS